MSTPHRVSFWVTSTTVTAVEMTETIGLEPDEVAVRGSRDPTFPSPRNHAWRIYDDSADRLIDDQARAVVERLRPHRDGLLQLAAHLDVFLHMSIYRELGSTMEPAAVGWHLDLETLAFLVSIEAEIDCDEYLAEPTFMDPSARGQHGGAQTGPPAATDFAGAFGAHVRNSASAE